MVGQGHESFAAAQLGAHVHGIAGDIARDRVGEISMTAADILEALPAAFKKLAGALGDKRQT
jgi:NAD(P)H-hydrate epimerase